jgi:hypothetical protein
MGALHLRHLPPRISQLSTGMLSYPAIGASHAGQADRGLTTEISRGMR